VVDLHLTKRKIVTMPITPIIDSTCSRRWSIKEWCQ
jgi:hypothetical protein